MLTTPSKLSPKKIVKNFPPGQCLTKIWKKKCFMDNSYLFLFLEKLHFLDNLKSFFIKKGKAKNKLSFAVVRKKSSKNRELGRIKTFYTLANLFFILSGVFQKFMFIFPTAFLAEDFEYELFQKTRIYQIFFSFKKKTKIRPYFRNVQKYSCT